ncbi:hypothetical protein VNO77_25074 [Canavalia gladiata]|uniref:Uncharacterized protein n=1 Tax=Canavalia gladiata TaxID=3824 RepID=A0AAN9LAW1_CANGL
MKSFRYVNILDWETSAFYLPYFELVSTDGFLVHVCGTIRTQINIYYHLHQVFIVSLVAINCSVCDVITTGEFGVMRRHVSQCFGFKFTLLSEGSEQ